ncbi:hypothetical protein [Paenibacillus algorifonticola]|uniref:hypothetical protein n=1 Tax=Paenibacillus algorifonticola TaxID=684063 RepID=UPI000619F705|nr:hypothetical protein [Paenibacillus algorifonticola]
MSGPPAWFCEKTDQESDKQNKHLYGRGNNAHKVEYASQQHKRKPNETGAQAFIGCVLFVALVRKAKKQHDRFSGHAVFLMVAQRLPKV